MTKRGIEHGAIFYPQTTSDPERHRRALALGRTIPSEYQLVQTTKPLFPGHQQPQTYCLGEPGWTNWDDESPKAMDRQIGLAKDTGLSFFLFDTYQGLIEGKKHRELHKPIETFQALGTDFGFASLVVMGSPRVLIPLKLEKNFEEPGRYYDLSEDSAKYIADIHAKNYWQDPNYLQVNSRPYLALMFPFGVHTQLLQKPEVAIDFVHSIRERSITEHKVDPYIAGVLVGQSSRLAAQDYLVKAGVNALTGYAFLPNFGEQFPFFQDYAQMLQQRELDWDQVRILAPNIPFSPPAVVGWDATPRGSREAANEKVFKDIIEKRIYPFNPIVTRGSPELFGLMAKKALSFVKTHSPVNERINIICAWNEVGEGAALLDRVVDGAVDDSYRAALRKVIVEG